MKTSFLLFDEQSNAMPAVATIPITRMILFFIINEFKVQQYAVLQK